MYPGHQQHLDALIARLTTEGLRPGCIDVQLDALLEYTIQCEDHQLYIFITRMYMWCGEHLADGIECCNDGGDNVVTLSPDVIVACKDADPVIAVQFQERYGMNELEMFDALRKMYELRSEARLKVEKAK